MAPEIKARLENVARVTHNSESSVVETALTEYFKNHGYNTRYVMSAGPSYYVLLKQEAGVFNILEHHVRNGVPLEEIRRAYAAKFNAPIEVEEADK